MVEIIKGRNVDEVFVQLANALLDRGEIVSPRGKKTIELNDVWIEMSDPRQATCSLPSRNINREYLAAEMEWYKTGTYDVNEIGKHSKFWYGLADEEGRINSNYGQIALRDVNEHGVTQFDWCRDKLLEDENTRQAVIVYNQPKHKKEGNKDFVCTLSQLFRNNNGKLDSTVIMRSNDMIFGLSYDLPWFTHVQERLAKETGLDIGKYNHFAASMHVYERHFGMLEKIAGDKAL